MAWLLQLLNEQGLPPHGFCLLWQPDLIGLHAISDGLIGIAYYAIPLALAYFVWRRRDLVFGWIFWMFAAFILACGTTHFMEIWVLWHPDYGAQGLLKAATALISLMTAVALWRLIPRALALPSPAQYQRVIDQLTIETEQRMAAVDRYRRSEETYRLVIEGLSDYAICVLDPNGRVTSWSASAQLIVGYTAQEIIGQPYARFYTADDQASGLPARALDTARDTGRFVMDCWRLRKDGARFWASVAIYPLRDASGTLIGFTKITRDITERRQAEETLEQTRAALAQAQKLDAIGQLTGGVAHDFNNLLTAILGGVELLEREPRPNAAQGSELLAMIRRASERGSTLTQRLLAFSRKQALTPRATDLNRLVSGLSDLLRRTLGEHIHIETVLAGGLWQTRVDQNQMESALLNLAVNARDAMPGGGKLTIETGNTYLDGDYAAGHVEVAAGQYVLVAVTDSGTGMSEEVLGHAFDPFFTTKEPERGTGLGLSQVHGFVKQSGGHIKLYSEPGRGTTAKIYLPRHVAADVTPAPATRATQVSFPHGSELILVVEDDEDVRGYSVNTLRILGYAVLEAVDGPSALRILEENPTIALMFTDVGLPGMNGRVLADEARRRAPALRVLFTTGYARNAIVHHGILDLGVHLLPKPFTIADLAKTLRRVLDEEV
jgi:PAS domain S-box-containing protein